MANVPQDHAGRGESFCTAILSTSLYWGRVGGGRSLEVKDSS